MHIFGLFFLMGSLLIQGPGEISSSDFYQLCEEQPGVVVFDVRPWAEFMESRIPDALYGGEKKVLLEKLTNLSDTTLILVYCEYGERSKAVLKILKQQGFKNTRHLKNGFEGWLREGFPVDSTSLEGFNEHY